MAEMFEKDVAGFTEEFDPNAEPGEIAAEPAAEAAPDEEAAPAAEEAPAAEAEPEAVAGEEKADEA